MINVFRLYLSDHTPPHREMITWGNMAQMVDSMSYVPEDVSRVMCHIMAYPTTEEPNNEIFWLNRNRAIFLEVVPPESIFLHRSFEDQTCGVVPRC